MIHYGDITKINGFDVPIVDVCSFGAPCQDISVAGLRKGMKHEANGDEETTRSGLFYDVIRIIKEMRENDRADGRADVDIRPRYGIYENVPGALSSNKGEDWRCVLESLASVAEEGVSIPRPENGKWTTSGAIIGDGWSIAWRILDAQFWGTSSKPLPQRRRRIALVADFGGQSAPEILFVRKSVSGNIEPSEPPRKETSCNASRGIGADDRKGKGAVSFNWQAAAGAGLCVSDENVQPLGCTRTTAVIQPVYSIENHPADSRVNIDDSGKVQTLTSRMGTGGGNVPMVMECYSKSRRAQSATDFETWKESDTANTLNAFDVGDVRTNECVVALDRASYNQGKNAQFDIGIDEKGIAQSLVAKGSGAVAYCIGNGQVNDAVQTEKELCKTLNCMVDPMKIVVADEKSCFRYIVRRLTPMECERLQGYPDGWTDIGEYIDTNGKKRKSSDAARYKALGNSIALPPWKWVMKRISACYERDATLASLFDGIGGFPYIWEQINGKGSCLWASEIEEFCIAVTKARIG